MSKVALGTELQFASALTAPPALPTAGGDGTDLSSLKSGGLADKKILVRLEKQAGTGDVTLTGPCEIYGYISGAPAWYLLSPGSLNNGGDVVVGDQGWAEEVEIVGAFDKFELVPAGVAGSGSPAYDGYLQNIEETVS